MEEVAITPNSSPSPEKKVSIWRPLRFGRGSLHLSETPAVLAHLTGRPTETYGRSSVVRRLDFACTFIAKHSNATESRALSYS